MWLFRLLFFILLTSAALEADDSKEPNEIAVALYVINIDEVSSAKQNFTGSLFYTARWKNPFLQHDTPHSIRKDVSEVWTPDLTLINQQRAWEAFPEYVEVDPDGTVTYKQKIWGAFSQPFDLKEFPFDQQTLTFHLAAPGMHADKVKITELEYQEDRGSGIFDVFSLPDFKVLSWGAESAPFYAFEEGVGTAGYKMDITIARHSMYYILKVILPLCMIVIMSWLPRWISAEHTSINVGISTTSFLTLIAYLFAIAVLLPKVSYLTRMDYFILLSTILVFLGLVHTAFDAFMFKRNPKVVERANLLARFLHPLFLLAVLMYSFCL